jgi:hypothetical protein
MYMRSEPRARGVILRSSMYFFPLLLLALGATGCANAQSDARHGLRHYDLGGPPSGRMELPAQLAEVSGLASTPDGRLLAHGDEQAVIFQIDFTGRKVVKRFAVGNGSGPLLGDFEDIQVVGDRIFLVTSAGELLETREGADGATVPVLRRTRGLRGTCEVEGLSWDEPSSSMLLLCKETRGKRWKDQLVILAVDPATGEFAPEPKLTVPQAELSRVTGEKHFAGSAMVRHPRTGTWILVAGPQRAFAEIDSTGKVLGGGVLPRAHHRQPEGLAIASDLTLLISDEAAGGRATITGYASRR